MAPLPEARQARQVADYRASEGAAAAHWAAMARAAAACPALAARVAVAWANVLVNSPNIVHQNKNGTHMTITDNGPSPTGAQSTIASAGIEAAYADIKNLAKT